MLSFFFCEDGAITSKILIWAPWIDQQSVRDVLSGQKELRVSTSLYFPSLFFFPLIIWWLGPLPRKRSGFSTSKAFMVKPLKSRNSLWVGHLLNFGLLSKSEFFPVRAFRLLFYMCFVENLQLLFPRRITCLGFKPPPNKRNLTFYTEGKRTTSVLYLVLGVPHSWSHFKISQVSLSPRLQRLNNLLKVIRILVANPGWLSGLASF